MLPNEQEIIEKLHIHYNKYYVPFVWASTLVVKSRRQGLIKDDFAVQTILDVCIYKTTMYTIEIILKVTQSRRANFHIKGSKSKNVKKSHKMTHSHVIAACSRLTSRVSFVKLNAGNFFNGYNTFDAYNVEF